MCFLLEDLRRTVISLSKLLGNADTALLPAGGKENGKGNDR